MNFLIVECLLLLLVWFNSEFRYCIEGSRKIYVPQNFHLFIQINYKLFHLSIVLGNHAQSLYSSTLYILAYNLRKVRDHLY
jgi:hypothetical protein